MDFFSTGDAVAFARLSRDKDPVVLRAKGGALRGWLSAGLEVGSNGAGPIGAKGAVGSCGEVGPLFEKAALPSTGEIFGESRGGAVF
jgi:hypothetical protein